MSSAEAEASTETQMELLPAETPVIKAREAEVEEAQKDAKEEKEPQVTRTVKPAKKAKKAKAAKKAAKVKPAKKAPKAAKKAAKQPRGKRSEFVTKKDVIIASLIDGGLEALLQRNKKRKIQKAVLTGAAQELEALGKTKAASAIKSIVEEMHPNSGKRGRGTPEEGETRTYSAQRLNKTSAVWVRVPVNSLGIDAQGKVSVKFEKGKIVVTAAK